MKEIKIVDPAVGSGAFPIGMMNEIVKARSILTLFFDEDEQKKRSVYKFKREAIENSLYGVDIDSSAVDIAKLRFWLSLIVDEQDIKNIKPLPNLDHKIMCGNSLLEEFEGVKLFDEKLLIEIPKDYSYQLEQIDREVNKLNQELHDIHTGKEADNGRTKQIQRELKNLKREKEHILSGPDEDVPQVTLDEAFQKRIRESQKKLNKLKELQKKFFNEQNRKIKKQLRADIDRIEWELIEDTLKEQGNEEAMQKLEQYKKNKSKPFFLWKLYFSEIFQRDNPGFDVVIANPPYVRQEQLKEFKEALENSFKTYTSTADLYTYFYEKGINILRTHGTLTFISSNKFMRAKYGLYLRDFLKYNTTINSIIDFKGKHIFEAITNTLVIVTKNEVSDKNEIIFADNINLMNYSKINQNELKRSEWSLFERKILNIKRKIEAKGTKLKEWNIDINYGIKTGYNDAFIIDTGTKNQLYRGDPKNYEIIKPIIRGRDIERYSHKWAGLWIINTHNGYIQNGKNIVGIEVKKKYPTIYEFLLEKDRETKGKVKKRYDKGDDWTNLRNCAFLDDFRKEKIIWIELTNKNRFSYSNKEEYLLAGAFLMTGESLKYLLSYLNSKLCLFYFKLICNSSGMDTIQWKKFAMEKIPVVKLLDKEQKSLIQLVDQILSITKDDDYLDNPNKQAKVKRLEKEIDQLVYKLYELTPKEIEIVEGFNKGK